MSIATRRWGVLWIVAVAFPACGGDRADRGVDNPVAGMPLNQQRTISRQEMPRVWPLSVGVGTLACDRSAVVFHHAGVTYALNDAARSRGFAAVDSIQLNRHPPPSNPLTRITQHERMLIFAKASACATTAGCIERIRDTHRLSDAELTQIQAEGAERRWPPLVPERIPLNPLIDAGLALCNATRP